VTDINNNNCAVDATRDIVPFNDVGNKLILIFVLISPFLCRKIIKMKFARMIARNRWTTTKKSERKRA
jgi:hypothetical protein